MKKKIFIVLLFCLIFCNNSCFSITYNTYKSIQTYSIPSKFCKPIAVIYNEKYKKYSILFYFFVKAEKKVYKKQIILDLKNKPEIEKKIINGCFYLRAKFMIDYYNSEKKVFPIIHFTAKKRSDIIFLVIKKSKKIT